MFYAFCKHTAPYSWAALFFILTLFGSVYKYRPFLINGWGWAKSKTTCWAALFIFHSLPLCHHYVKCTEPVCQLKARDSRDFLVGVMVWREESDVLALTIMEHFLARFSSQRGLVGAGFQRMSERWSNACSLGPLCPSLSRQQMETVY